MDKVLVTGGTGFVGKWLQKTQPKNLNVCYIGREEYNLGQWQWFNFDYIIHAAPVSPEKVLTKAQKFGARVLYVSSGIVYHDEWDTDYRQVKLAGEKDCLDSGLDVVIARLFTFYGEGLDENKAVVQFAKAAKEGGAIRIWGNGKCIRSYMHGEEMARWLWAILLRGKKGEAYDVGSDEPMTLEQLAYAFIAKYPATSLIIEGGRDPMPVYLPTDTAKTKALL